jgi:hypothetical protein
MAHMASLKLRLLCLALSSTAKVMASMALVIHPAMAVTPTTKPTMQVNNPLPDRLRPDCINILLGISQMHFMGNSIGFLMLMYRACFSAEPLGPQSHGMTVMYPQQFGGAAQHYHQVRCPRAIIALLVEIA